MTRISTERTYRVRKTLANFSAEKTIDKTDRLRKTAIIYSDGIQAGGSRRTNCIFGNANECGELKVLVQGIS